MKLCDSENPSNATAVINTLIAVTFPVPSLMFNLSENKLDITVPIDIIIVIIPAEDNDALSSMCICGHAEPNRVSGKPKLINAK